MFLSINRLTWNCCHIYWLFHSSCNRTFWMISQELSRFLVLLCFISLIRVRKREPEPSMSSQPSKPSVQQVQMDHRYSHTCPADACTERLQEMQENTRVLQEEVAAWKENIASLQLKCSQAQPFSLQRIKDDPVKVILMRMLIKGDFKHFFPN